MAETTFDEGKFEQLQGKVMGDVGGAVGLFMAYLGDQAGVYQAMEKAGACSHVELADVTGLSARYLREWLSANAAFGYVDYDAAQDTFSLNPEQAALFAHEGEPTCMQGFFQAVVSQYGTHETAVDVFKTGRGRPWGEHSACCFCGTDRFFRPGYAANLVDHWIPALSGVEEALKPGGTFMLVEPIAGDSLAENLNLLSGIFYGFSTTICVPTSKAQDVGLALGAQAGQARLTEVLNEAGFTQVRRAAETPTNMVLEAIA